MFSYCISDFSFYVSCFAVNTSFKWTTMLVYIEVHRDCSSWLQCSTVWRLKAISSEGLYCYYCIWKLQLQFNTRYHCSLCQFCIWLFLVKIGVTLWKRYIPMAHQSMLYYISAVCVVVAILFHLSNMYCSSVFSMILNLGEETLGWGWLAFIR